MMKERLDWTQLERFDARIGADQAHLDALIHQPDNQVPENGTESIECVAVNQEGAAGGALIGRSRRFSHVAMTTSAAGTVNAE